MLVVEQLTVPIDYHSISFSMEVNGEQQLFGSSKSHFKLIHSLEQHEGEETRFHFWVNYSFNFY